MVLEWADLEDYSAAVDEEPKVAVDDEASQIIPKSLPWLAASASVLRY